jgi:hypothetical protein
MSTEDEIEAPAGVNGDSAEADPAVSGVLDSASSASKENGSRAPAEEEARRRRAPGSKTATRKAKRGSSKRSTRGQKGGKRSAAAVAARQAKFPRHAVVRALRIPQALYDQNGGRPASLLEAVRFTGGAAVSGPFRTEVSSAKKYGFLDTRDSNKIAPTDRARRAIAPQSPTDRLDALREGLLVSRV